MGELIAKAFWFIHRRKIISVLRERKIDLNSLGGTTIGALAEQLSPVVGDSSMMLTSFLEKIKNEGY